MPITLNGNTGIVSDGGYVGDGLNIADTAPANSLTINTAGNVALGMIPSPWASNRSVLQLKGGSTDGGAFFVSGTTSQAFLGTNAYSNGTNFIYLANGVASLYAQDAGAHTWFNAPNGTAGNTITLAERMTLDASGNLGIGTSSPISKLQVNNGYIVSGTESSTQGSKILGGYYSNGNLATFGGERSNGGPVIGYGVWPSTTTPGAFVSATTINVQRGAYTIFGANHVWYGGAPQTVAIDGAVTITELMRLNASGNLNLGTVDDGGRLNISGANGFSGTGISLYENSTGAFRRLRVHQDTDGVIYNATWSSGGNAHIWQTGNTERTRINSSGQMFTTNTLGVVNAAYDARAWVNFIGAGTVGIRGSGNVSSITDNGVGDYTITFNTAMSDNGYAVLAGQSTVNSAISSAYPISITTSAVRINCQIGGGFNDPSVVSVVVFR